MNRTGRSIGFLAVLFVMGLSAICSAAEVTQRIKGRTVAQGQPFLLEVYAQDADSVQPSGLPRIDNVRSEFAGVMNYVESINFKKKVYKVLRFVFISNEPGTYTIPSFEVIIDGSPHMTDPVTYTVIEGGGTQNSRDPFDLFDRMFQRQREPVDRPEFTGIRKLSRDVCYAGETLIARYYITAPRNVQFVVRGLSQNSSDGLIIKRLGEHLDEQLASPGDTGRIQKHIVSYAVTPAVSGNHSFTYERGRVVYELESAAFSHALEDWVEFSNETLDVLPLPEEGKPADYSGNVGSYTLTLDRPEDTEIEQFGTYTLTVTISGKGSFQNLTPPVFETPDAGVSIVAADVKKNFSPGNVTYEGSVSYSYSVVPELEGECSIGPFRLTVFNPYEETYEILSTEAFTLHVQPAEIPEDDNVLIEEHSFPVLPLAVGVIALMLLVLLFVFQIRREGQKQTSLLEKKQGKKRKSEHSSNTKNIDLSADDIGVLYLQALDRASQSGDSAELYRELKRSLGFVIVEQRHGAGEKDFLTGLERYLQQLAYGGGAVDIRILEDIKGKIRPYLSK